MTTITGMREGLATELEGVPDLAGVHVSSSWPETIETPCVFLTPPLVDDYVRRGPTFGEHTVGLDILIAVDDDSAVVALAELERLLAVIIKYTADWNLLGVDSPAPTTVVENGAEYLACVVHLSKPTRL
jgi:hypothetical protein